eukprot:TRINITY_DN5760_c0_g1_i6.p2 TRINITY_DN5760_c0_g1~~TRINITY_DN5760_c0_g1_i6.p2  ORF type:complete len:329 (+),score=-19.13 TRINITY_DN5760_c0_g1_i6:877-1863(+)
MKFLQSSFDQRKYNTHHLQNKQVGFFIIFCFTTQFRSVYILQQVLIDKCILTLQNICRKQFFSKSTCIYFYIIFQYLNFCYINFGTCSEQKFEQLSEQKAGNPDFIEQVNFLVFCVFQKYTILQFQQLVPVQFTHLKYKILSPNKKFRFFIVLSRLSHNQAFYWSLAAQIPLQMQDCNKMFFLLCVCLMDFRSLIVCEQFLFILYALRDYDFGQFTCYKYLNKNVFTSNRKIFFSPYDCMYKSTSFVQVKQKIVSQQLYCNFNSCGFGRIFGLVSKFFEQYSINIVEIFGFVLYCIILFKCRSIFLVGYQWLITDGIKTFVIFGFVVF